MTRAFIGTSGWNYDHWRGPFYPEGVAKKDWLPYYAQRFPSVEVNYSFYRWPSEESLERWRRATPTGFRFSLKARRTITHRKHFSEAAEQVERLYELGGVLGPKMGCFLFQLPPSFTYGEENVERLRSLLGLLDGRRRNAVEFRDPAWWREDVYSLLREAKVSFCSVEGLGMPGDVVVTGRSLYVRLHGRRYDTLYDRQAIARYARALEGAGDSFVYFNNDAHGYAPKNASELLEAVRDA